MSKLKSDFQLRELRLACEAVASRGVSALTTLAYGPEDADYKYGSASYVSIALDYARVRAAQCHL